MTASFFCSKYYVCPLVHLKPSYNSSLYKIYWHKSKTLVCRKICGGEHTHITETSCHGSTKFMISPKANVCLLFTTYFRCFHSKSFCPSFLWCDYGHKWELNLHFFFFKGWKALAEIIPYSLLKVNANKFFLMHPLNDVT